MPSAITAPLYTTVKNVTDKERFYGYLGKHGRTLAAGAEYTIFGHIQHSLGHGEIVERKRDAILRDLDAKKLAILETPQVVVYEATAGAQTNPSTQATVDTDGGNLVANPTTQLTASATGGGATGGALAAGNYYIAYTWVDEDGNETTIGTSVSAQLTVGSTNIPRVTIPALPSGAVSANIYVSDTGGTNTAVKLYKTGVTTTTADLALGTWLDADGDAVTFANAKAKPDTNATGSGAEGVILPAGTYYVSYSWLNQDGESTVGTSRSAQFTVVAGNIPQVTIPSLPTGATGANIYLTEAGGASGSETLYKHEVSSTTVDLDSAEWYGTDTIPTANTATAGVSKLVDLVSGSLGLVEPGWFPELPS
jgi:methionine-rich copper-binding protein CopC